MSEWSLINSAYCLNLERNVQRWEISQQHFNDVSLPVERINCIESLDNRYLSFNQSHYDAIKQGYEQGGNTAIFEDDIVFDRFWKHIEEATNQLPENWEALYLGGNIMGDWQRLTRIASHIAILHNAHQTHAIIYSQVGAKFVLDNFDTATFPVYDEWLRVNLMPRGKTFMVTPMICYQRPGYSDVWQTMTNYKPVHFDGNEWIKENL